MQLFLHVFEVLCGLALFLYGMGLMSSGLESAAGSKFKNILDKVTKNRLIGVITGTFITAIIQSSSATTVMIVGLVNAGLLNVAQSVGLIMGANIGTTMTGIIVSLNVSQIAPIAVFIGLFIFMFAKRDILKFQGQVVAGFGILFLGMTIMGDTLKPLASDETALALFEHAGNPFLALLLGLVFTSIIQSSSATIGILIVLGGAGLLDLHSAIFMIYGACIGTCVTAVIASLRASKAAKQVSVVHLTFNITGTIIFMIISLLPIGFVDFLERSFGNDVGRQIALSAVVFKVTNVIIMFPFAKYIVKVAQYVIPIKEEEHKSSKRVLYIDEFILNTPHIAIEQTQKEVERMAQLALENYRFSADVILNKNQSNIESAKKNEETINFLNHEITKYLIKLSAADLQDKERKVVESLHHVINDIERIGDHAENIMEYGLPFIKSKDKFSDAALEEFKQAVNNVEHVLVSSMNVFAARVFNIEEINRIKSKEQEVDSEVQQSMENHVERLNKGICKPSTGMLFINMLSDLERVSDHAVNIVNSLKYDKDRATI